MGRAVEDVPVQTGETSKGDGSDASNGKVRWSGDTKDDLDNQSVSDEH